MSSVTPCKLLYVCMYMKAELQDSRRVVCMCMYVCVCAYVYEVVDVIVVL